MAQDSKPHPKPLEDQHPVEAAEGFGSADLSPTVEDIGVAHLFDGWAIACVQFVDHAIDYPNDNESVFSFISQVSIQSFVA